IPTSAGEQGHGQGFTGTRYAGLQNWMRSLAAGPRDDVPAEPRFQTRRFIDMPVRASTRFVKGETARSKSTSVRSNPFFVFPAVSLLLLVPCYWQSRIQAADLSSHVYNAWLAQLIGAGHAKGLILVPQTTNVLFDLILSALFQAAGADAAQRIAVPAA